VSFAADDDDEPWAVGPPNAINIPKDMEARSRRE